MQIKQTFGRNQKKEKKKKPLASRQSLKKKWHVSFPPRLSHTLCVTIGSLKLASPLFHFFVCDLIHYQSLLSETCDFSDSTKINLGLGIPISISKFLSSILSSLSHPSSSLPDQPFLQTMVLFSRENSAYNFLVQALFLSIILRPNCYRIPIS